MDRKRAKLVPLQQTSDNSNFSVFALNFIPVFCIQQQPSMLTSGWLHFCLQLCQLAIEFLADLLIFLAMSMEYPVFLDYTNGFLVF